MGCAAPPLRGPVHSISVLEQVHDGPLCSSVFTGPLVAGCTAHKLTGRPSTSTAAMKMIVIRGRRQIPAARKDSLTAEGANTIFSSMFTVH